MKALKLTININMKYTKGEDGIWHPVDYAGTIVLQAVPYYGEPDLFDYNEFHDSHYTKEEATANAKLASKAPEMYELLKECWDFIPPTIGTETKSAKLRMKIETLLKKMES